MVKTDGSLLVRVDGGDAHDVRRHGRRRPGSAGSPCRDRPRRRDGAPGAELLLVGDRAVVLSTDGVLRRARRPSGPCVRTVDLGRPARPRWSPSRPTTRSSSSARQHGDTVRLVVGSGLPDLDFVQPDRDPQRERGRAENRDDRPRQHHRGLAADGPRRWRRSRAARRLRRDAAPGRRHGAGTIAVVGFDAAEPGDARSVTGVATASHDRLLLDRPALPRDQRRVGAARCCADGRRAGAASTTTAPATSTRSTSDGNDTTYLGSGEVDGAVRDRWAMDAADGVLRVAVGPTGDTGNFNSVVTFRERDGDLVEAGRVDRLGVDEEIKSVRWFDDLAFVVTFRQVDPLYADRPDRPGRAAADGQAQDPRASASTSTRSASTGCSVSAPTPTDGSDPGRPGGALQRHRPHQTPSRSRRHGYGMRQPGHGRRRTRASSPGWPTAVPCSPWSSSGAPAVAAAAIVSVLAVGEDGGLTARLVPGEYGYDDVGDVRTGAAARRPGGAGPAATRPRSSTCDRPVRGVLSSHVPQHPPAQQLRAAGDRRRGHRRGAAVRPQGQRDDQAVAGQPGGLRPGGARDRAHHPAPARRPGHHRAAQGPRGRGREGAGPGGAAVRA